MLRRVQKGSDFVEVPTEGTEWLDAERVHITLVQDDSPPPSPSVLLQGQVLSTTAEGGALISCGGLLARLHDTDLVEDQSVRILLHQ